MSRIQEILNKAEREGTVRRTRGLSDSPAGATATAAPSVPGPRVAPPPFEPGVSAPWTPAATAPALEPPEVTTAAPTLDARLVAALAPQSAPAERYRLLRTRVKRAENGRSIRTIVVTSPAKGDGKSLTAANLALTMAQEFSQRVLLLDADLRRPSLAQFFGIAESPGLSDVLIGGTDVERTLVHLPDQHLTVLPAGSPAAQPAELLGSSAMRRVLELLRGRFDRILIDMPPVAPLADVHVISPMIDGLLMVVRAGITPKPAIERALSGLDMGKVLGLVLNAAGDNGVEGYGEEGYGYIGG
jgi:capsular exopolysaccharide synthesis family protein